MIAFRIVGLGGTNPWSAINLGVVATFALIGGIIYGLSAFWFGLLTSWQTFYFAASLIAAIFSIAMLNLSLWRSATLHALLMMTSSVVTLPAFIMSVSLAYFLGYPPLWIVLTALGTLAFVYWSQSQEVRSASMRSYINHGVKNNFLSLESKNEIICNLEQSQSVLGYFKNLEFPHKNLAKTIRGIAIAIGIIVIPFGQKEVYADPTREYQNMPIIMMILSFVFFVMVPHVYSSQFMLIKLDRAIKRGEVEPNEFAKADEVA